MLVPSDTKRPLPALNQNRPTLESYQLLITRTVTDDRQASSPGCIWCETMLRCPITVVNSGHGSNPCSPVHVT
jgi:hypothetical protein